MTIDQAMRLAIERGWRAGHPDTPEQEERMEYVFGEFHRGDQLVIRSLFESSAALDPSFWQSLGKEVGWKRLCANCYVNMRDDFDDKEGLSICPKCGGLQGYSLGWKAQWHRFIDHLAEGKSPEDFFTGLSEDCGKAAHSRRGT